jgi:hypothetical protein
MSKPMFTPTASDGRGPCGHGGGGTYLRTTVADLPEGATDWLGEVDWARWGVYVYPVLGEDNLRNLAAKFKASRSVIATRMQATYREPYTRHWTPWRWCATMPRTPPA